MLGGFKNACCEIDGQNSLFLAIIVASVGIFNCSEDSRELPTATRGSGNAGESGAAGSSGSNSGGVGGTASSGAPGQSGAGGEAGEFPCQEGCPIPSEIPDHDCSDYPLGRECWYALTGTCLVDSSGEDLFRCVEHMDGSRTWTQYETSMDCSTEIDALKNAMCVPLSDFEYIEKLCSSQLCDNYSSWPQDPTMFSRWYCGSEIESAKVQYSNETDYLECFYSTPGAWMFLHAAVIVKEGQAYISGTIPSHVYSTDLQCP